MDGETRASSSKAGRRVVESYTFERQEEKAFLERVTDLFQSYSNQDGSCRQPEPVSWISFLQADCLTEWWLYRACYQGPAGSSSSKIRPDANTPPPCSFVALSTPSCLQIWTVENSGCARELLAVSSGLCRQACLLPSPSRAGRDSFSRDRPLVALVQQDSSERSSGAFTVLTFYSLLTSKLMQTLTFSAEILNVLANSRVVAVSTRLEVALLNAASLEQRLVKVSSVASPFNALALGDQWLAFTEHELHSRYSSRGGVSDNQQTTYTAAVLNAAKSSAAAVGYGIGAIGSAIGRMAMRTTSQSGPAQPGTANNCSSGDPGVGIVTIVDTATLVPLSHDEPKEAKKSAVSISGQDNALCCIVAHFKAHSNESLGLLQFDSSGTMLVACGSAGRHFNLYRIDNQSSASSCETLVHHLYSLYRGDTSAMVHGASFSADSRWLSVTTDHGTSHVFAILPDGGGPATLTSHSASLPNNSSLFESSSGSSGQCSVSTATSAGPPREAGSTPVLSRHGSSISSSSSSISSSSAMHLTSVEQLATGHPQYGAWLATSARHPVIACTHLEAATLIKPVNDLPASTAAAFPVSSAQATSGNADQKSWSSPGPLISSAIFRRGGGQHGIPSILVYSLSQHALIDYSISISSDTEEGASSGLVSVIATAKQAWPLLRRTDAEFTKHCATMPMEEFRKELLSRDFSTASNSGVTGQQAFSWHGGSAELQQSNEVCLAAFRPLTSCMPYRLLVNGPQFEFQNGGSGDEISVDKTSTDLSSNVGVMLVDGPWRGIIPENQYTNGQLPEEQLEALRAATAPVCE